MEKIFSGTNAWQVPMSVRQHISADDDAVVVGGRYHAVDWVEVLKKLELNPKICGPGDS